MKFHVFMDFGNPTCPVAGFFFFWWLIFGPVEVMCNDLVGYMKF